MDLQIAFAKGEIFCLMGELVCGKSTTARILIGIEAPSAAACHYAESFRRSIPLVQTRVGQVCIYFVPAKADGIFSAQQIIEAGKVAEEGEGFLELILDLPLGVVVREDFAGEATRRLVETGLRLSPRGATVRNVAVCPTCDHGIGDYISEGVKLDEEIAGRAAPKAMHVAAAGCGCDCAMSHLQDIGFVKRANGLYDVFIGGSMYGTPQEAKLLCKGVPGDQMAEVAKHVVAVYEANKRGKWRLGQVLGKIGIEAFCEGLPYSSALTGTDE